MSEKPPDEKEAALSGSTRSVPPTAVTYGQAAGKVGKKRVVVFPSLVWHALPGPELEVSLCECSSFLLGCQIGVVVTGAIRTLQMRI